MSDEEDISIKIQREKDRINDIFHLAKTNNGIVETRELSTKWNIHPEHIQSYIEYLMRIHQLPISHIEKGYPKYYLNSIENIEFHKVQEVDRRKSTEDYFYPKANENQKVEAKRCTNCGRKADNDRYCGYCGYDLTAAK